MQWRYTLSEPALGQSELDAVADCIRSGWLSMGPRTETFERRFAAMTGAGHAIAVANGTAALHLALAAVGVGERPDDEVVQPSINFVAAANMTRALGARPVFGDIIAADEPTIAPGEVQRLLTARTRAVVVMHFGGYPARMAEIAGICAARDIPIIEDACHAPVQRIEPGGDHLGTIGRIGCFSFFSNKNMTTAEGGMVVTGSDALAGRVRNLRSHGMTSLSWDRHHGRPSSYDVTGHGFNYRIDDLRSALGLAQLDRLEAANATRRRLAARYVAELGTRVGPRARYLFADRPEGGAAHLAGVVVAPGIRDAVRNGLAARGIQTSLHYPPIHRFSAFSDWAATSLPVSEAFAASMITLPMHAGLDEDAVTEIVAALGHEIERHG